MFQQGILSLENGNVDVALNPYPSIPEEQRQMAVKARHEFKNDKYSECLETLKKLQALRPQDVKVFHNIAVAEYYNTHCTETIAFYNNLLNVCKQAHIDEDFDLIDDVDFCVVFYNKAVVMYHLQKYEVAIELLDKVFQFVEPLEEALALKICFLLIELYLIVNIPRKALGIANYVENTNFSKGSNYGKASVKDGTENAKAKLIQYRARCYTKMKTFKPSKREVKSLMASKIQDQHIAGLFIKSELEYSRNNFKKALRIITSAQYPKNTSEHFLITGDLLKVYSLNNLACIHFSTSKISLGIHYLSQAMKLLKKERESVTLSGRVYPSTQPIHTLRGDLYYKMAYNIALMYFKTKDYKEAFRYYLETAELFAGDPVLWLRIAECCVRYYEVTKKNTNSSPLVKYFIGDGPNKKAILYPSNVSLSFCSVSKSQPLSEPTLNFALHALKTSWNYLPCEPEDVNSRCSTSSLESLDSGSSSSPYLVDEEEVLKLRHTILLNCSYVSLCTGDVFSAYEYAVKLLSEYKVAGFNKYLASTYAAQALVSLDKISEAIEYLNPDVITNISMDSSEDISFKQNKLDFLNDSFKPKFAERWITVPESKSLIQYNLAVIYTIRGEWARACNILSKISSETSLPVKNLQAYIDLCQGATDVAKNYLRNSFPHSSS